jgi:endoglucanase
MTPLIRTLRQRRWHTSLIAAGLAAAVVGAGVAVATNALAAAGCRVVYTVPSQWPGGFTGNVAVTNLGDPINGWQLVWTFPNGQAVQQAWSATISPASGTVTATNMSYNAAIATNATVSFGFNGSWSGTNGIPGSFTLNGTVCTGSVGNPTTTQPPTSTRSPTPTGTRQPTTTRPPTTTSQPPTNRVAAVAAMQPGWNLGNTFDSTGADETSWGNPVVTQALLDNLRTQGFRSIRIPVTWGHRAGGAPSYTINATFLNRVREVVDWALARDFYVMINMHHDSWQWVNLMPTQHDTVLQRYNATWTQIAAAFRNHSPRLVFESINEPQFTGGSGDAQSYQLLHELNASFRNIVRASGGNNSTRLLVLPTLHTNADQGRVDALVTSMNQINDPNTVATFHFYGFWPFSVNIAGFTRFNAEVQADLVGQFDRMANAFTARGIPVILGEYGLLGFDRHTGTIEQGEKLKFFEYFGFYARQRQITTQLWDNGQHLGRTSFAWSDQELYTMIRASWTTRAGTASDDFIFSARASAITAKSLTLNTNGHSVVAVRQGTTNLAQGTDYTISGSTLTLTAAALTRLSGSRAYGVNATIHVHYSAGPPWRINIVTFDTPILSNASGSTGSYNIPTQFRGDQLATMEAVYTDGGGNAGPQNWTSFKEFDFTFAPNYSSNTITLKPEFFAEVNDNRAVRLTFHFWSGARINYTITKNGGNVTGTA